MIRRLDIYDFDGTLANSPEAPGAPDSWWDGEESLLPPCVPRHPGPDFFVPGVASAFKRSSSDPWTYTAVVTGRVEPLRSRIAEILRMGSLVPDELHLRPSADVDTKLYKVGTCRKLIDAFPALESVDLWEDNMENLAEMEDTVCRLGYACVPHLIRVKRRTCVVPERIAHRFLSRSV